MDSENFYEKMEQFAEITLGKLSAMHGPDTKIVPFIVGLLKNKNVKIPIDIIQEIKEELDKKSLSEQHSAFHPRAKQQETKEKKSAIVLLLKKMLEKLNEYDKIKGLEEIEKEQICNEIYEYFKDNLNNNNINNIFKVEEGETNQIDTISEKIVTNEAVKEILNQRKKGGTLKKRNKKKKSIKKVKKKLI